MKSLDEEDLADKIHKFKENHNIKKVTYSTCPYSTDMFHKVWHCILIEYGLI
jgi:uncharacterized protein YlbG (UPF0298 family)